MMPVVKAARREKSFKTTVAVTGQHRQMLDQVFTFFGEKPDIDLNLMAPSQTLAEITANVVLRMTEVLNRPKARCHARTWRHDDCYGRCYCRLLQSNSHRSRRGWLAVPTIFNGLVPEFNRVAIDAIADYMFAPTQSARENLLGEYNRRSKILVTGNTGIDALLYVSTLINDDPTLLHRMSSRYDFLGRNRDLILVTGHRRESFGDGFERICDGLLAVAATPERGCALPPFTSILSFSQLSSSAWAGSPISTSLSQSNTLIWST